MYNKNIHNRIEQLGQVISDLKSCESEMRAASDPALVSELQEELNELALELDYVGKNCIKILEAYFEDCRQDNIPIFLDYKRVYNELKNASLVG